jgi:hypothetical protein
MHDRRFCVAEDRSVIATRVGDYALTAAVSFDQVFGYYFVKDCNWYRSDLSKISDSDVPDHVRYDLLRHFRAVLG